MLRTLLIITLTTPVNETLVFYLGRKRKLRRNLRKSMERLLAPEKHFAFRGRLMSLRVLPHCGVSSRPSSHRSLHVFPPLVLEQTVFLLLIYCCLEQKTTAEIVKL